MSRNVDCDFLVFLLEMARIETVNIQRFEPTAGRKSAKSGNGDADLTAEQLVALFMQKSKNQQ